MSLKDNTPYNSFPPGRKRSSTEISSSSSSENSINSGQSCSNGRVKSTNWNRHSLDERELKRLNDVSYGGEDKCYRISFKTSSGETSCIFVNAHASTSSIDTRDNFIVGELEDFEDVTEAAKHDKEVASTARELRQLLDMANVSIFGIDMDGKINEWNKKTAFITGYSLEEALGSPFVSTFIVPELQLSIHDMFNRALKGDEISN